MEHKQIIVIEDKDKFALRIGIPLDIIKELSVSIAGGVVAGAGTGMLVYLLMVVNLGFWAKCGILLGLVTAPIGLPITLAVVVAVMGTAGIASYRCYEKFMVQHAKKSFNRPLDLLGSNVAQLVFMPIIGMALADGVEDPRERELIKNKMIDWGYDACWVKKYYEEIVNLGFDEIKSVVQCSLIQVYTEIKKDKKLSKDTNINELQNKMLELAKEVMIADGKVHEAEIAYFNCISKLKK